MYLRYVIKYRFPPCATRNIAVCANRGQYTESELQDYSPYSKSIWYRYIGMPQRNLHYASPSGNKGVVPAECRAGKEAGIEIVLRASNTWFSSKVDGYSPPNHSDHLYSAPTIDEVRLLLERAKATEQYIELVIEEYKQFIITSNRRERNVIIPQSKIDHHYFSISFNFYTDDFLRFNMQEKFTINCPITGNLVSNYPFDLDFRHPDSVGNDTKVTELLLGSIASVSLPDLDAVLKNKFTHDKVSSETIFIVNNPNTSGLCVYPAQFYLPVHTYVDDQSISKYKRISTIVVPGLENGVYSSFIASDGHGHDCTNESAKWTCISIEDALTRKIIFYTENDVIEHVDLRIKDRRLNHEEVESKIRKLEIEDKIAVSKVQETAIKSNNNNLIIVTGAITAVCTLVLTIIKTGVLSSNPGLCVIGFIPKLMCSIGAIVIGASTIFTAIRSLFTSGIKTMLSWIL